MATTSGEVPRLLTVKQLAERTGIPRWRWYELLPQGKGPAHLVVGRTYRFTERAVVAWIERNQEKTA